MSSPMEARHGPRLTQDRFFAVRLFADALQDLLVSLRAYAERKDRLFFTVCYDCKALSERGAATRISASPHAYTVC